MIKLSGISMRYGKKEVLNKIDLMIDKGSRVAIVGDSGCGKSTLARIMIHLTKASEGKVLLNGKDLVRLNRKEKATMIQMVFQHPITSFNPKKKIGHQLSEVLKIHQLEKELSTYLEQFALSDTLLDRYPFQISGGEAQRLSIIRALLLDPEILVLDEATSMLDVSSQAEVFQHLLSYQEEKNITLIVIAHDLELVSKVCDEIVIINEGKIIESGSAKMILDAPKTKYTKTLVESFNFFYE